MKLSVALFPPLLLLLLGGCATVSAPLPESASNPACQALLRQTDALVKGQGVADAQAFPVHGFPYLRTDRFLTSFRDEALEGSRQRHWVERMRELDRQARRAELANLTASGLESLRRMEAAAGKEVADAVEQCANAWMEKELAKPGNLELVRENLTVPPEYDAVMRLAGLYYLSAWPIKMGVVRLHKEIHAVYEQPLDQLPLQGMLMRYEPPAGDEPVTADQVRTILAKAYARDPLGIPRPNGEERARLFNAFAPTLEVDTASVHDLVGFPHWPSRDAVTPAVDPVRPTLYRMLSHTRWQGQVLLQLNYVFWFPSRPPLSATDILAGNLDGLMWRVTLSPQGRPLVYDTAHNCGCYHLFFPTAGVRVKPEAEILQEPAFAPQQAPEIPPGQGAVVRLSAVSHFVDRVSAPSPARWKGIRHPYHWADYDELRSLPTPEGGRRSLFREDGIVPGTERGERWILWPMGVPHPGEMRQWGHHATAFFGHRHFDDPDLMERSLSVEPSARFAP